jgi:NADP-dependent 3-hydroxy acid dehydrogenase YdfG
MQRNKDERDPMPTARDQIVFITGANGGIGASMMSAYAESCATVIGADRGVTKPQSAAGYYDFDVTDEVAATATVKDIISTYGRIDALVHAAGVLGEPADP